MSWADLWMKAQEWWAKILPGKVYTWWITFSTSFTAFFVMPDNVFDIGAMKAAAAAAAAGALAALFSRRGS